MSTPPPPPNHPPPGAAPTPLGPPPGVAFSPPGSDSGPGKKRSPCLIAVLVGCGGLLLLGIALAVVVGFGAFWVGQAEDLVASDEDRRSVLTIDDLARAFPDLALDASHETLEKLKYPDESIAVEYEYDDQVGLTTLYVSSALNVEVSQDDAEFMYSTVLATNRFAAGLLASGESRLEERPELLSWGEESSLLVVYGGGEPVGNVFAGRKGWRVVSVLMIGAFVDDAEGVEALLGPVLESAGGDAP